MPQSRKTTGEPCVLKGASTVRRGAAGKGTEVTSPAAYPTKPLILRNAAAVILGHNHPSGDPQPSREDEDRAITQRLKEAGALLGTNILDHIVVGDGKYFSFADEGLLQ
jgi:DNA repair protein RadC